MTQTNGSDLSSHQLPTPQSLTPTPSETEAGKSPRKGPSAALGRELEASDDQNDVPFIKRPQKPVFLRFLLEKLGPKHYGATLENFNPPNRTAARVLAAIKDYAHHLPENIKKGTNILIFGPPGTGKDHLLIALAKLCAASGTLVTLTRGSDLLREAAEAPERIDGLKKTPVLYIQDPLPPIGGLTPSQSSILFEIVDYRWQRNLPIWCSLNVSGSEEAENRLGAATIDRLSDGALVLQTNWPSYRKPQKIITQRKEEPQSP